MEISLLYKLLVDFQLIGLLVVIELLYKSLLAEVVVFFVKFKGAGVEDFLFWLLWFL